MIASAVPPYTISWYQAIFDLFTSSKTRSKVGGELVAGHSASSIGLSRAGQMFCLKYDPQMVIFLPLGTIQSLPSPLGFSILCCILYDVLVEGCIETHLSMNIDSDMSFI